MEKELKKLEKNNNIIAVIIFGSYARGDFKRTSDLDVLIITNKNENFEKIEKELSEKFKMPVNIYSLTKEEFKENVKIGNNIFLHIFKYGKVIFDKENIFNKMKNLFVLLHKNSNLVLISKKEKISIKDLL